MKIKVNAKFKLNDILLTENMYYERESCSLQILIKYKKNNQIFYTKFKHTLVLTNDIDDFYNKCLEILNDEDFIMNSIKDEIKANIQLNNKHKHRINNTKSLEKQVEDKLKSYKNGIKFEFEC